MTTTGHKLADIGRKVRLLRQAEGLYVGADKAEARGDLDRASTLRARATGVERSAQTGGAR